MSLLLRSGHTTAVAAWLAELSVEIARECAALVYYALTGRLSLLALLS
jgi:hypothetical protein